MQGRDGLMVKQLLLILPLPSPFQIFKFSKCCRISKKFFHHIFVPYEFTTSVKMCTQKAQQDLRHEENIDAFSMSGDAGRISPALLAAEDSAGTELHFRLTLGSSLFPFVCFTLQQC